MPDIIYSNNPNEETAFVEQEDGSRNRVVLTAAVEGEISYPDNPNSTKVMVTVDGVKRRAVAVANVAGSGGGDQHNLGYYTTQAALEEAYPTAEAGDWAIVGATDTVWIWDEDNSAWVDSDQKGQVTSVNGQTGVVTLTIPDAVQYSAMPTASADNLGDIVQFTGTTDASYTNGYFYKCVSDGQNPATYSWTQVDVQPSASGYLPLTGGTLTGDLTMQNSKVQLYNSSILGSFWLESADSGYLRIGKSATASNDDLFVNTGTVNQRSIAFGDSNGGRIGSANAKLEYVYTQKLSNGSDIAVPNVAGKMAVQVSSMPTASSTLEGQIYQYIGTTDSTYTHGYIYECVSDGADPATYSWTEVQLGGGGSSYTAGTGIDITSGVISVTAPTLQNTATGTNSLTVAGNTHTWHQTMNIGGGTSVSGFNVTGTTTIGPQATGYGSNSTNVGAFSKTGFNQATAYGASSEANALASVALGYLAKATAQGAIQINASGSGATNSDANTFKVGNANGNFELMNANGNLPADRLASTTGLADGNYRLRLVMASGVPTLEWVAE